MYQLKIDAGCFQFESFEEKLIKIKNLVGFTDYFSLHDQVDTCNLELNESFYAAEYYGIKVYYNFVGQYFWFTE